MDPRNNLVCPLLGLLTYKETITLYLLQWFIGYVLRVNIRGSLPSAYL